MIILNFLPYNIYHIHYLPYTTTISATALRDIKSKVGSMNYILSQVVYILNESNIPYYLDWGTLLGCVRDHGLMEQDIAVHITVQMSMWHTLKTIDFSRSDLNVTKTYENNMMSIKHNNNMSICCNIHTNPVFPKLSTKTMNGVSYTIPCNSVVYLEQLYGRILSKTNE